MKLTSYQQTKIDPLLQEILTNADGNEHLTVIFILDVDKLSTSTTNHILPSEFPSRAKYRQALIEHRKQQLATKTVKQFVTDLMDLSLTIQFQGEATGTLVVEGTTAQILKSLDLAGIKLVLADQVCSLAY